MKVLPKLPFSLKIHRFFNLLFFFKKLQKIFFNMRVSKKFDFAYFLKKFGDNFYLLGKCWLKKKHRFNLRIQQTCAHSKSSQSNL
ncbi:hypothetical protein BpHYR1_044609 [Brachionus plicatilis]|uniref:Uncharacterized protein n=1 Tax=Brachionus plicatilis TaxID=10195 RepID=A0A3M7PSD9_BRAPC|nr:hypothetical protein BpHYR1_044609 [Brachionus plicatilis]